MTISRFWCAAAVAFVPMMAHAAALQAVEKGSRLEVELACAKQIDILADPGKSGEVSMEADAVHPEEIAQIAFSGGDAVRLKAHGECWPGPAAGRNFQPTLTVVLHVPARFALGIAAAGSTDYRVDVGGTLAFDLSGSGDLEATQVTKLDMDIAGSGMVHVAKVDGPIGLDLSGSAKVTIGQADSDTLSAKLSGSGNVRIDEGSIGKITVDGSGSSNLVLGGSVGDATVDLSGSGGVSIGKLLGKLGQDVSGSGAVHVLSH